MCLLCVTRWCVCVCSRWCFSYETGVTRTNMIMVWMEETSSWRRDCRWVMWRVSLWSCVPLGHVCWCSESWINLRWNPINMKSCRMSGNTFTPVSPTSAVSCCHTPASRWPPTHTSMAGYEVRRGNCGAFLLGPMTEIFSKQTFQVLYIFVSWYCYRLQLRVSEIKCCFISHLNLQISLVRYRWWI